MYNNDVKKTETDGFCSETKHLCSGADLSHIIAVSNRHLCERPYLKQVARICRQHPEAFILREKDLPEEEYLLLADQVMDLCRQYEVPCIIHNFLSVARRLDSSSIHLPLPVLREHPDAADEFRCVGTSVHSLSDALEAEKLGASYITAGHIYATDCKKGLPPRGLSFLQDVCSHVTIPVYAIGGIHLGTPQITEVMDCGAAGACIMSQMMRI